MFNGFNNTNGGGDGNNGSVFGKASITSAFSSNPSNSVFGQQDQTQKQNVFQKARGRGGYRGNYRGRGGMNVGNNSGNFNQDGPNQVQGQVQGQFQNQNQNQNQNAFNNRGGSYRGRGRGGYRGGYQNQTWNPNQPQQQSWNQNQIQNQQEQLQQPNQQQQQHQQQNNVFQSKPSIGSTSSGSVTIPGFRPRNRPPREIPAFLSEGYSSFTTMEWKQDAWDVANQQEMLRVEKEFSGDMQALYEQLQAMREKERAEMERRGLVEKQDVKKNLKDAITFVGSCTYMCPVFERMRRTYENNVKQLEKDPITGKVTTEYAVKAFSRPAAGQPPPLPSDVRPPHILKECLNYLVEKMLPKLPVSHSFLWDRTRSIRQDFTYQNYSGKEAIECNEIIARIHVICLHRMAKSDVDYSKQQEIEQLTKTLQTLSEIYDDNRKRGLENSINEPEMRAFQLLIHLKDQDIEFQVQQLPLEVYKDERIQIALRLRNLLQQNRIIEKGNIYTENTCNLFSLFFESLRSDESIPPLYLCLLESSFNEIRLAALSAMSSAYHRRGKPYYIGRLKTMLGFDSEQEVVEFCRYYEIGLVDENGIQGVELASYNSGKVNAKQPKNQPFSLIVDRRIGEDFSRLVRSSASGSSFGNSRLKPFSNFTPVPSTSSSLSSGSISGSVPSSISSSVPAQTTTPSSIPAPNSKPTWANIAAGSTTSNNPFGNQTTSAFTFGQTQPIQPIQQPPQQPIQQPIQEPKPFQSLPKLPPQVQKPASTPSFKADSSFLPPLQKTQLNSFNDPFSKSKQSTPSSLATPMSTTLSPKAQSPASPSKPTFTDSMINKQIDKMIRETINSELSMILPTKWNSIIKTREERSNVINNISHALFNDMITKLLYKQSAQSVAEYIDSKRIKLNAINLIKQAGYKSKQRVDLKRKKQKEIEIVSQLLGKTTRRVSSGSSSSSSRLINKPLSQKEQINLITKARNIATNLWSPLNTNDLLIPPIESKFREKSQFDRTISLAVFSNDWESTTGTWIRKKLSLEWDGNPTSSYSCSIRNNGTVINISALQDDATTYSKIALLIFECGVNTTIEQGAFNAVLSSVIPKSSYKISILIINWDNRTEEEVFKHLQIDQYKSHIERIIFCHLNSAVNEDISLSFSSSLKTLAQSFTATLSKFGVANEQQRPQSITTTSTNRTTQQPSIRYQNQEKWAKRINSMNSLHILKQQPPPPALPLSPKRKRSISDFGTKTLKSIKTPSSPKPIPKALSELQDLVSSVLQHRT